MSFEYDEYLQNHRANVKRGYDWMLENLPEVIDRTITAGWRTSFAHDKSKNEPDEYDAYDAYFYGNNRSYEVVQNYNRAWLLHIHRNPHHWQHWILINDDPKEGEIILEMPYDDIVEMICDWWAFSWSKGKLDEIFKWYEEHSKYMKLAPKTRETVEDILDAIKEKLENAGDDELMHHGVKGQKWGVKNGPPYPIQEKQKVARVLNSDNIIEEPISSGKVSKIINKDEQKRHTKDELARVAEHDNIVEEAISSGKVSKTINKDKQKRHTKDEHTPGRSYLNGDCDYAQKLVNKHGGNGTPLCDRNGNWLRKEKFDDSEVIGTHVSTDGVETYTKKGMIVYSKTGTHVYPRKESE